MNVLITGSNGFVGRYLSELLQERGHKLFGIDIQENSWAKWIKYQCIDITDFEALRTFIEKYQIEIIYHLAAIANPRIVDADPLLGVQVNVIGPCNLLECARINRSLRILFVGSSEQYRTKTGNYIRYEEYDEQHPHNMYGATKIAFEIIGKEYQRKFNLKVTFTRSFNHTGIGQPSTYVLSSFAEQIRQIKNNDKEPIIIVGNIKAERDFTDVRDVVRAYELIVEKGVHGEIYNVCSGKAVPLENLLKTMLDAAGLEKKVKIEINPSLLRIDDPEIVFGDNSKLILHTGWKPMHLIENTVREFVR